MPNWGKPDFDTTEVIDYDALHTRILREYPRAILFWPYQVAAGASPSLVQKHCVQDPNWQKTRLRMKGQPTHIKLKILHDWWFSAPRNGGYTYEVVEVQVVNYLGALRRGGQLDENNRIRKYI